MSVRRGPAPQAQLVSMLERWEWSQHELAIVAVWLQICSLLVVWLS